MALEIRHIKEEELDAFNRNVRIAFAAPDEAHSIKVPVEWTLCAFENAKLATSYMAWPLTLLLLVSILIALVLIVWWITRRWFSRRHTP